MSTRWSERRTGCHSLMPPIERETPEQLDYIPIRRHKQKLVVNEKIDQVSMFDGIVGSSKALKKVLAQVATVAPTDSTTLILGETGTGKELIASAIHRQSNRSLGPYIRVNCATTPPSLVASELFGYEPGAFTGATQRRVGRFELADGGTIFLDEVGELTPDTQVTLLRVLQEREFERVGGAESIRVDVRVIAATNRELKSATAVGTFRPDLFYRLNVFPIELPALRERRNDIPLLLNHFVQRYSRQMGKDIRTIDKKTFKLFQAYHWPGNIRELQNVVERSVILSSSDVFSVDESWICETSLRTPSEFVEREKSAERRIIEAALAESKGRIAGPAGAAAKLRIPRSTLESKIRSLQISKSQFKFG